MNTLGSGAAGPVTLAVPGAGHAVITHTTDPAGPRLDIALSIVLPDDETQAAHRAVALVTHLRTLIGPARTDRPDRP
jgi:hypothetical protein